MDPKLQLFSAEQLAQQLLDILGSTKGPVALAIPGGRSPGKVLGPMAQKCSEELRERLHLYWVDERCVPLGDADRNDQPTLQAWTSQEAAPAHVFPMPAEKADRAQACSDYTRDLVDNGFSEGVTISLLGIGEDGHFASLFPNHPKLEADGVTFYLEDSPKPPPARLSLTLPFIRKSKRIDVLVFGKDKGDILKKGLENPSSEIPISLLAQHPEIHYHLDDDAMEAFHI